jgi:hypothetical protein
MNSRVLIVVMVLSSFSLVGAEFDWLFQAGGIGHDKARAVATDLDGNVYATGEFTGVARFGGSELKSEGTLDFCLVKIDSKGKLVWAKSFGGAKIERGYAVATDRERNVVVTGHFQSPTLTIGSTVLTNRGDYDVFVVKYAADGAVLWARSAGGPAYDYGHGVAIDEAGRIYVSGAIRGGGQFDSGESTEAGSVGPFVAAYSEEGRLLWNRTMTGKGSGSAHEIAVTADGRVRVGGYVSGTLDFGGQSLRVTRGRDIFAAAMDARGKVLWVRQFGGAADGLVSGIGVDAGGSCFVSGMFKGTAVFDGESRASAGDNDLFVARLDEAGRPLWWHVAGGKGTDYALGLAVDGAGNCLVTGETTGDVEFAGRALKAIGRRDLYVAGFAPDGRLNWVKQAGGTLNGLSYGVSVSPTGRVVFAGAFSGELGAGGLRLNSHGSNDLLVGSIVE